ncbi:hypothetical protein M407DRAFT_33191 [Tulasnella calospora MUT 4182]|uniref:Uncharacterized protein n=1 Tax=Tulasnella calospora MUT 4182 TaxID=1051891 RepID=A0A0C3K6Y7_9AGAM|nr:hypothetical protein M407DRAFT_33191 [Tulasnella calospora MUT 4182]
MSIEAAKEIFDIFMKKDFPEVTPFLKPITTIEVSKISPDGRQTFVQLLEPRTQTTSWRSVPRLIGAVQVQKSNHSRLKLTKSSNSGSDLERKTKDYVITHYVDTFRIASSTMAKHLDRINDLDKVEEEMNSAKLFPHVALAFPLPDPGASSKPSLSGRNDLGGVGEAMNSEKLVPHAVRAGAPLKQPFPAVSSPYSLYRSSLTSRCTFTPRSPSRRVVRTCGMLKTALQATNHGFASNGTRSFSPGFRSESSPHKKLADVLVTPKDRDPKLLSVLAGVLQQSGSHPTAQCFRNQRRLRFMARILTPAIAVSFLRYKGKQQAIVEARTCQCLKYSATTPRA